MSCTRARDTSRARAVWGALAQNWGRNAPQKWVCGESRWTGESIPLSRNALRGCPTNDRVPWTGLPRGIYGFDSCSISSSRVILYAPWCAQKPASAHQPCTAGSSILTTSQNITKYYKKSLNPSLKKTDSMESNLQFCRSRIVLYESFGIGRLLQRAAEKSWSKVGVIYWLESIYYMLAFRPQGSDRAIFLCIGKPGASTFQNFWTC